MTTDSVNRSWARIEAWLKQHAPGTFTDLLPPATDEEIAGAEDLTGVRFPTELIASLRRHNGNENDPLIPGSFYLLRLQAITAQHILGQEIEAGERQRRQQRGNPIDARDYATWHPQWLPIASNAGGGHLILDARDEPSRGKIGWRDELGQTAFGTRNTWPSLEAMLESIATSLHTGTPIRSGDWYQPAVEDGHLEWEFTGE